MNLTVILEVVIGLVVVWFILSMATIQFQELIASLFKLRAKDLEKSIGQMLSSKTLVDDFYNHPLIQGLMEKPNKKPSYVPAREFTLTLFNIITTAGTEQSAIQQALHTLKDSNLGQINDLFKRSGAKSEIKKIIDEVGKQKLTQETIKPHLDALIKKYPDLKNNVNELTNKVKEYCDSVGSLPAVENLSLSDLQKSLKIIEKINPKLARSMNSLISGAGNFVVGKEKDLAVARTYVENWFNNAMDRMSGWYKRRSQIIAFVIGLVLAIFLNIDSVAIAQKLWIDPTMREAILQIAPTLEAPPTSTSTDGTNAANTAGTSDTGTTEPAGQQATTQKTPQEILSDTRGLLDEVGLPIGWVPVTINLPEKEMTGKTITCAIFPPKATNGILPIQGIMIKTICYRPSAVGVIEAVDINTTNWLLAWIVGILISALATTQGAPFWFDIMSKLINIRGAGVKPSAETPAETPKEDTSV